MLKRFLLKLILGLLFIYSLVFIVVNIFIDPYNEVGLIKYSINKHTFQDSLLSYNTILKNLKKEKYTIVFGTSSSHLLSEETLGEKVLNFCANNYLGLADNPELVETAQKALKEHGYGMASVRFICGTQDVHKELEARLSKFLGMEDTILYSSCFDANGGLFETYLQKKTLLLAML